MIHDYLLQMPESRQNIIEKMYTVGKAEICELEKPPAIFQLSQFLSQFFAKQGIIRLSPAITLMQTHKGAGLHCLFAKVHTIPTLRLLSMRVI